MIRINLLPREEIPKQHGIRLPQLGNLAPLALVLAVVAVLVTVVMYQNKQVADLQTIIAQEEEETRRLAPEIAKIKRLNKQREELNERLDVINSLDRDRYFRVHLLDELNRSLPEHMWLTRFSDVGGDVYAVEGVTFSNFVVSDFLQNMNRSPFFTGVNLIEAKRGTVHEVEVVTFKARTTAVRPPLAAAHGG